MSENMICPHSTDCWACGHCGHREKHDRITSCASADGDCAACVPQDETTTEAEGC